MVFLVSMPIGPRYILIFRRVPAARLGVAAAGVGRLVRVAIDWLGLSQSPRRGRGLAGPGGRGPTVSAVKLLSRVFICFSFLMNGILYLFLLYTLCHMFDMKYNMVLYIYFYVM